MFLHDCLYVFSYLYYVYKYIYIYVYIDPHCIPKVSVPLNPKP